MARACKRGEKGACGEKETCENSLAPSRRDARRVRHACHLSQENQSRPVTHITFSGLRFVGPQPRRYSRPTRRYQHLRKHSGALPWYLVIFFCACAGGG